MVEHDGVDAVEPSSHEYKWPWPLLREIKTYYMLGGYLCSPLNGPLQDAGKRFTKAAECN